MKTNNLMSGMENLSDLVARRIKESEAKRKTKTAPGTNQDKALAKPSESRISPNRSRTEEYEAFLDKAREKAASLKEDAKQARLGVNPYKKTEKSGYFQLSRDAESDPVQQKRLDALNSVMAYLDFARTLGKK